jgi:DNA-binding CsgD family transcriptional regulator
MAASDGRPAVPLLGRRREREVLDRLVADVLAGRSQVLVLRGGAGVGKSALLDHLSHQLSGWRVASTVGVQSEMELAYSGLHQLCTPLLNHVDDLPSPQRSALVTAFGLEVGPAPDRFLVALATLSLVAQAAEHQPVACIVDDAQWLDSASAQALTFLARRLLAERVALVCAARTGSGDDILPGMPELEVPGLPVVDARRLLLQNLHGPLDPAVTDRIVAESRGNPLALLELPRTWTSTELAGGFGMPAARTLADSIERSFVRRLRELPWDTQLLVLVAAAEPLGDPMLLRRAAETLGIDMTAAGPATTAELLEVRGRVQFPHPLVRSAAYWGAAAHDRRRVHRALAEATDPKLAPDRRAWHRAAASPGPDEDVATELERAAQRARARGGSAAAAAFLTRATELTTEPTARTRRALDAAMASLQAGAVDTVHLLLTTAEEGPVDELQRARSDLVRAQLAFVSRRGKEAAPLLLSAARRLEPLDPELARETYLDAFSAAQFAARSSDGVAVAELARAARQAARRADAERTPSDALLEAFAALTDDEDSAIDAGRAALTALREHTAPAAGALRLLWQGSVLALELWDDDAAYLLSQRHLEAVRGAGALSELPLALSSFMPILVLCGDVAMATALVEEARSLQAAAGSGEAAYGALTCDAWRGLARETDELIRVKEREATARGEGIGIAVCEYARAVLCNGQGHYGEALPAARLACADPRELVVHNWGLSELVESAMHTGRPDLAEEAHARLSARARRSGTEWALGMEARARALVTGDGAAEDAFTASIQHLGRARVRAELARSHLLYGEWLRQSGRQLDARRELRTANEMFTAMDLRAFAGRSRRELLATGDAVHSAGADPQDALTAQEAQIARLARDGMSNPEIGAQLFISARTVEWHLRKVFLKLGITSRRQLRRALADRTGSGGTA